ncbi:MAG: FliM/FliN family flagellar motor switch protein [Candidatus Eremiobacteraeota bacterium]|nr:FliM/FliN family flagellar motor switch protein [Candidatus Eremiobacteraeota bacterium]
MTVRKRVRVRLMEPTCPEPSVWTILTRGARLFEVRGTLNTAAFVLQKADALVLARMPFDEVTSGEEELSRLEEDVLARLLQSLASTLSPVCGDTTVITGLRDPVIDLVTFFEILVEEPAALRLGVGLTRDTIDSPAPLIRAEQLLDISVGLNAESASSAIDAATLSSLRPGTLLSFGVPVEGRDSLMLDGKPLAFGSCGQQGDRRAFSVTKRASPAL